MVGVRSPVRMLLEGLEGTVLLLLAVVSWPVARRSLNDLGASAYEREGDWPGDRLLDRVDSHATRGITIHAPAAEAWPWLPQFGLGRGGFHSYELLERIGGIDVRNLERIRPELQSLAIGEEIKLHPSAPGLFLASIEPGEHLCFRTWKDEADLLARDPDALGSFSLYLVSEAKGRCRFVVRTCKRFRRSRSATARFVARYLEEPLDLVMEQRMLRTVRRLAER